MEKKVQRNFLWIALLVLGTIWILARHNQVTAQPGEDLGDCASILL